MGSPVRWFAIRYLFGYLFGLVAWGLCWALVLLLGLLLLVYAPSVFAIAARDVTVTVPTNQDTDTRGFCPFVKGSGMPDIDINEGETLGPLNLNNFGAAGDADVVDSPLHGDKED